MKANSAANSPSPRRAIVGKTAASTQPRSAPALLHSPRMKNANNIWGVVAAAGVGARMGGDFDRPKQYLPLGPRRVIDHALLALCERRAVRGVVVGIRDGDRWWRAQPFAHAKLLAVSRGGESRARTVLNALRRLLKPDGPAAAGDWVLVHDAARPCVAARDIERLIAAARAHGHGAALALPVTDALKRVSDGVIEAAVENGDYWRAATPQMFRCGALAAALQDGIDAGRAPADEAAAMACAGVHAAAVAGHPANLKITVAADLELAAGYLSYRAGAETETETARERRSA